MKSLSILLVSLLLAASAICQNPPKPDWHIMTLKCSANSELVAGDDTAVSLFQSVNISICGTVANYDGHAAIRLLQARRDTVVVPEKDASFSLQQWNRFVDPDTEKGKEFVYTNKIIISPDFERNSAGRIIDNDKNRERANAFLSDFRRRQYIVEITGPDGARKYSKFGPILLPDVEAVSHNTPPVSKD